MFAAEDYRERWVIGLVSAVVFCLLYIPLSGHPWAILVAAMGAYSGFVLTYLWVSDECVDVRVAGWVDLFKLLGMHLIYLLALFVWMTFFGGVGLGGPRWFLEPLPGGRPAGKASLWELVLLGGVVALLFSEIYLVRRVLGTDER